MGHGGKRAGAGRKGSKAKLMREAERAKRAAEGILPVDYMLQVMRDEKDDADRRLDAAKSVAPYLHKKLPQDVDVTHKGIPASITMNVVGPKR